MAEVDKVSVKFDADVNSFTRGVNKMERELDDFNRKADKTEKNVNTRFELMNRQVNKLNKTIEKTGDDVDLSDVMKQLEMARDEFDRTGIIANKTFKNLNKAIDDVDMDKMSVKTRKAFNTLTKDVTKLGNQTNALKEIEFAKRFDDQSKGAAIALKRTMTQLISLKKVESDIEKEMSEDSFKSYKKGLSDLNKQIFITHKELRETGKVSKTTMNELNASINNVDFKPLSKKASTEFDMIKRNIDTVSKSFDSINKSSNRSSVYFGRFIGKSKKGLDGLKEDFSKTISRINRIGTAFRNLGEVAWGAVTGIILSVLPAIIPIAGAATTSIMAIGAGFSTVAGGAIGLSGAFGIAGSAALLFQKQASYALKMLEDGTLSATNEVREYQNALDDLKSSWEELIAQNQAQIFHTMTNGINAAKFALGALNPFLTTTAQQVEQSSNKMYKWVTSSQNAQAAFNMLNARGPSIFQNLLNSAGYAGNGITRIFTSFGPLFSWTAQGIENLSRKFDNWANSSQVQQGIADFINYTKKNLPTLGSIFGNTFIGIIELFKAFSGQTQWALGGLDNLMLRFRRWAETLDETQGFKDFIKYTRENAPIVGELIGNIVEILVQFVKAAAPVGSIVLKIVTAVTGWIAKMLETHPVLAKVIASVIAMSGAFKLLSIFFGIFFSAFGRIFQGLVMFIGFASRTGIAARLLGAAFTFMTGPIALVIGLIIAVGGALILLYKKNEWFRNMVNQTWSYIKALAIVTFTAIKVFLINTWNSILAVSRTVWSAIKFAIQNPIQALKLVLSGIWSSIKNIALTIWQAIKNSVIRFVQLLFNGVKSRFSQLFNAIKSIMNSLKNWISNVWSSIRNLVIKLVTSLYNGVKNKFTQLSNTIKKLIANLKSWLINIWNSIRNNITSIVNRLWNVVRNIFNKLVNGSKNIFRNFLRFMTSTWNSIKRSVTGIASSLWNGVRRTFNNMSNGLRGIIGRIKGHIGGMVSKIKSGLNSLIRGLNWVGSKLSLPKIPTLSTGTVHNQQINRSVKTTSDGRMKQDTMAIVGDKGPGNGKGRDGRRELIQYPNGRTALTPAKDTPTIIPKGGRVISGGIRQQMTGELPKLNGGTWFGKASSWIGSKMRSAGDWLKDRLGDVLDFVGKPGKLLNKLLSSLGIDFGSLTKGMGIVGQITRGAWSKIKDGATKWLKNGLDSAGGDIKGGILDPDKISYFFGHTAAYTAATGRYWHEGVDFPFVYQPVKTPMGGKLIRRPFMDGGYGNWVSVISGAMEMIFAHLRDFSRSPASGSTVKAGDVVGLSGNTGFSTGPHLHFGTKVNGVDKNPEPYLRRAKNNGRLRVGRGGGGLGRIEDSVLYALKQTGLPTTKRFVDFWGNKINEKKGTGLLDINKTVFNHFKEKGYESYNNTLDNLMAGMNYAKKMSGGLELSSILNRDIEAYSNGGIPSTPQLAWIAEGGFSESIISHNPAHKVKSKAIWDRTGEMLGYTDDYELLKELVMLQRENNEYNSGIERHTRAIATEGFDISMDAKKVGKGVAPYARTEIKRLDERYKRYS